MNMLSISGLRKQYRYQGRRVDALKGIAIEIAEGELCGFLGHNGAGKSTTFKILLDLVRADAGEARIAGYDSRDLRSRESLGFLPELPAYIDTLTGRELITLAGRLHGMDRTRTAARTDELLALMGITDAADRPVRKYSKGMVQKVGFACAIIHEPRVLLLDEPMSGLDPMGRILFKKIIKDLHSRGTTIFFSTHIIPDVEDLCTRVIILRDGTIATELDMRSRASFGTARIRLVTASPPPGPVEGGTVTPLADGRCIIECGMETLAPVCSMLDRNGIAILDASTERPDLEDLFVQLAASPDPATSA